MNREQQQCLRRALVGQLESLQRAGVLNLAKPRADLDAQQQAPVPRIEISPISTGGDANLTTDIAKQCDSVRRSTGWTSAASTTLFAAEAAPRIISTAPSLENLQQEVTGCTRCGELARTRTQTVFGVGNPRARLCFLGEAPGADEDRLGEPFVGRAGQLLDRIIEACTMKRSDVYICNILKCRPPGNRNPNPEEAANCRYFLERQLELIEPEFICCLGAVAAQNLLNTTHSIGKLRGKSHTYRGAKVVCTYHPAYLLRNPAAKKDAWEDMKFLMREMGVEL
jgi:DNA polymerase